MDMPLSSVAMGPDAWHDRSGGYAALGSAGAQELAAKRWLDRWGENMSIVTAGLRGGGLALR